MALRVLVLGAGFGGLELATVLSDTLGEELELTLIDKGDAFVFGYAKLDLMFGTATPEAVRNPYAALSLPGVRFVQETVLEIDPQARAATTERARYEADVLVVALGADYDLEATPGLAEHGNEFYSVAGAAVLRGLLPAFRRGRIVVGVCAAPFKCPPAPSEAALLLHEFLSDRGVRDDCEITLAMPFTIPIPPSPETSQALLGAFAERGIGFVGSRRVERLDGARRAAVLDDGSELPYDLFLGVPRHRAPDVVIASGMSEKGYIPVDSATLATRYPGVYAVGDVTTAGVPKAGVFAEGAARVVAAALLSTARGGEPPRPYDGRGSCYVEFGGGRVGRVDIDFLGGPRPTGSFQEPSLALREEKEHFGSSRRARWFRG